MEGITDAMRQYETTVEQIIKKNPKHGKEYGVKRPESAHIVAVIVGLITLSIIIVDLLR